MVTEAVCSQVLRACDSPLAPPNPPNPPGPMKETQHYRGLHPLFFLSSTVGSVRSPRPIVMKGRRRQGQWLNVTAFNDAIIRTEIRS